MKAGFDARREPTVSPPREAGAGGDSTPAEARAADSQQTDRAPDAGCKLGPFAAPVNLGGVNTIATEYSPAISTDGLTLIFGSPDRPGGVGDGDLWIATRASASDAFGPSVPLAVDTAAWEGDAALSFDGLAVYFDRGPAGSAARDIYVATRTSVQSAFTGLAKVVDNVNSAAGYDGGAAISADGLELFFTSNRPGGAGGNDIWVARRASNDAPFPLPAVVEGVNSMSDDGFPSLTGDGMTLYFETNRGTDGKIHIWSATRGGKGLPFVGAAPAAVANSGSDDGDPEISADGRTLYFASNREGGKGGFDIWSATRSCQ